jgi:tRNA threonylcarbamoyladenosine biosynthesis protein TsaB
MAGVAVLVDDMWDGGPSWCSIIVDSMVVLALDTTMRSGSCALERDGHVILEHAGDASVSQAARLPRELMVLLGDAGLTLGDVDVFAVATGPGSFTGLRVGIATMQGLAFAEDKPLIGVSTFEALAAIGAAAGQPRIATWVDAWRGDVFAALYEGGREIVPPAVATPRDLLRDMESGALFIGDGAALHRELVLQTLGDRARIAEPADPLLAGTMATRAAVRAEGGEAPAPHAIRPLYVRRSDAELARMARDARASH